MSQEQEGYAVTIRAPQMVMTTQDYADRRRAFDEFVGSQMKQDIDYGTIPGTKKPTLYKPGAEKIARMYGVRPSFVVEWQEADALTGYLAVKYRCQLVLVGTDRVMAEGLGLCSSFEKKYRYRKQWWNKGGKPPEGESWEKTKGGKFFRSIPNPDLVDTWNTVDKMSQKRSMVAASLCISGASERFTQDMEDFVEGEYRQAPPRRKATQNKPNGTTKGDASWTKDKQKLAGFWAWAGEKTLSNDDVHEALDVESIKDYAGDMGQAKTRIIVWIGEQIDAKDDAPLDESEKSPEREAAV